MVAATWDGQDTITFYINGLETGTCAGTLNAYDFNTYEIGGNNGVGDGNAAAFNGDMADVSIYNTALTPLDMAFLYNGECPRFGAPPITDPWWIWPGGSGSPKPAPEPGMASLLVPVLLLFGLRRRKVRC
jgi:hypothetical protein